MRQRLGLVLFAAMSFVSTSDAHGIVYWWHNHHAAAPRSVYAPAAYSPLAATYVVGAPATYSTYSIGNQAVTTQGINDFFSIIDRVDEFLRRRAGGGGIGGGADQTRVVEGLAAINDSLKAINKNLEKIADGKKPANTGDKNEPIQPVFPTSTEGGKLQALEQRMTAMDANMRKIMEKLGIK